MAEERRTAAEVQKAPSVATGSQGGGQTVTLRVPQTEVKVDPQVGDGQKAVATNTQGAATGTGPTAPVGRLHRTMGISIKTEPIAPPTTTQEVAKEAEPLTLESLTVHWQAMLEAMGAEMPKLAEQLKGRELRMEEEDKFVIVVNNSYAEAEIRPHLIRMLTFLRARSGRPKLNCRVEVVYEEHEAVAYTARDKYDVMLRANPALESLRVLFPEVDI